MINIYYNYYKTENNARQKEIDFCLEKMIQNRALGCLYILSDKEFVNKNERIVWLPCSPRPSFKEVFEIIESRTSEVDVNLLLNSDCFVDENSTILLENISQGEAYCILRREILYFKPLILNFYRNFRYFQRKKSDMQDAWAFRGKPPGGMWLEFLLGVPGCDNRIAYEFQNAGYIIRNPFSNIRLFHVHKQKSRGYSEFDRIPKPYAFPHFF